jgi:voltage-gated potassium channel
VKIETRYQHLTLIALTTLGIGTVFYHFVEKWNWLDSLYFCVVTLATVGYGDFTPKTELGRFFTIFYILTGVGIIASFAHSLLERAAKRREEKEKEKDNKRL